MISSPRRLDADRTNADLANVNAVVVAAVRSWALPDRVMRNAVPSLLYDVHDLRYMHIALLNNNAECAVGVVAWEDAGQQDTLAKQVTTSLHGLYVVPQWQRRGVGDRLLSYVSEWAVAHGAGALVLRAWRESESFFLAKGFTPVLAGNGGDAHPRRLGKMLP